MGGASSLDVEADGGEKLHGARASRDREGAEMTRRLAAKDAERGEARRCIGQARERRGEQRHHRAVDANTNATGLCDALDRRPEPTT